MVEVEARLLWDLVCLQITLAYLCLQIIKSYYDQYYFTILWNNYQFQTVTVPKKLGRLVGWLAALRERLSRRNLLNLEAQKKLSVCRGGWGGA